VKSGILLLDKEPGMTSFDCIRNLKRTLNRSDLGHGGTLDLFASGLLPVLVGEGLKLARFFLESHPNLSTYWKTYSGIFQFGTATDTADPEGDVIETRSIGELTIERMTAAMNTFAHASYDQTPPRFSAKKFDGVRASDLVRQGKDPEMKTARITLKRFVCTKIEGNEVHFEVECSKGTYVRSLAVDLARKLDTVAHVKSLRRIAVGEFSVERAVRLDKVSNDTIRPLAQATSFLGQFPLIRGELEQLRVGRFDNVAARLANSGFPANVYCATEIFEGEVQPVGLFELTSEYRVSYLRGITPDSKE
jgi:tRNA pseudouridine55 synthase